MTTSDTLRRAPFLSADDSALSPVIEQAVALLPLIAWAAVKNSLRVLIMAGISVLLSLLLDQGVRFATTKIKHEIFMPTLDLYPMIIGLIAVCMLPSNATFVAVLAVDLVATLARRLLGGVLSPCALGYTFLFLISNRLTASFVYSGERVPTPLDSLYEGTLPDIETADLLLGRTVGAVGELSVALLVLCFLYLFFRGHVSWEIPIAVVGVGVLVAFELAPDNTEYFRFAMTELCSGSLIFGGIFVAADRRRAPSSTAGRLIYGALIGALSMLTRMYLKFDGVYPTIAILSLAVPLIDRLTAPVPFGGVPKKSKK